MTFYMLDLRLRNIKGNKWCNNSHTSSTNIDLYDIPHIFKTRIIHAVFGRWLDIANIYIYMCVCVCVLSSTEGLLRCITTLDTQEASSWDRKPTNFTLDMLANHWAISVTSVSSEIIAHICISFRLLTFYATGYQSVQFVRRALYYTAGGSC